jgi:hypothetical protein
MLSARIIGRPTPLQHECQPQGHPKVRRVGDTNEEARDALPGPSPEHDIAGDDLVEAASPQLIRTRQIDQPDGEASRRYRQTFLPFDLTPG